MHDATAWARLQKTGSTTAKFVLFRLADYAGTDYSCYPSVRKLAEDCEMGESTVRQATKLLAELGLIRVFYRHKDSGLRRSCRYQLLIDGPDTMEPDVDDWANYRQISADDYRQDLAVDAPGSSGSARQDLAVIPTSDPSLKEPPVVIPGASRTARATRLPEDFIPTPEMREWFAEEKLHLVLDARIEHEKFVNYWVGCPGMKGRKLDWPRTWKNWMWTQAERAPRRPGNALAPTSGAPYKPSTTDQRIAQGQALAAKYREQGL